ncbi:MAG TPA: uroporphyrinogen decarboxylase family protein, partial [Clostridia bacterium]|nr:uroporphyrinogen decarboxylase family protein [Clostridia bacterium]
RWYRRERTERTPFVFSVPPKDPGYAMPGCPYTYRELCEDADKVVDGFLCSLQHQFDTYPDCDYLPCFSMHYMGEGILAAMYGAKQYVVEKTPPFTQGRVFHTIEETVRLSNDFEVEETEWGKKLKEHMLCLLDATDGEIPISGVDYQSPYGTATKLLDNEALMMALYDDPALVHAFFQKVTDGICKLVDTILGWIGPAHFALNRNNPIAGDCGIILWDDYVSVLTPALHTEFCAPYNRQLFVRYGQGHLHTCGPYFPSYVDAVLACRPRSVDVSILRGMGKTREDLEAFVAIMEPLGLRMFGGLRMHDVSIFEGEGDNADDALLARYVRAGLMPSGSGTQEEGRRFAQTIARIDAGEL